MTDHGVMQGKTVLITGANSGVGFVVARDLARGGARVLMVCRDPERGARAHAAVASTAAGPAPELLLADVSLQRSIRALVAQVKERAEAIDVLINNAGGVFARRELTEEGIEKTFATNHLGAFLLTLLLLDLVHAAAAGRIVNVVSEIYASRLDFDNLQGEKRYSFLAAYRCSKLAGILFTFALAERLRESRVTANCVSPGATRTRFGDNMTGPMVLFPLVLKRIPFLFASPERGAQTAIHLASSPEVAGRSGRFYFRGRERQTKPVAHDRHVATRLWNLSESLCAATATIAPANDSRVSLSARP